MMLEMPESWEHDAGMEARRLKREFLCAAGNRTGEVWLLRPFRA